MASIILNSPYEISSLIRDQAKAKRLSQNISQHTLAERSGVSLGSLKKFERTGKISLESLLKIALVLESLDEFTLLFKASPPELHLTLDKLLEEKTRRRGRQ